MRTGKRVTTLAIVGLLLGITSTTALAASTEGYAVYPEYGMPGATASGSIWLDTGITLLGGSVTVTGSGQARTCDPAVPPCRNRVPLGPDGTGDGACAYLSYVCTAPNVSEFALLAALGTGPPILIGSGPVTLSGQGRVYLAYNDGRYDDNCVGNPGPCGFLQATVEDIFDIQSGMEDVKLPGDTLRKVRQITLSLHDDAGLDVSSADKVVRGLTLVNTATGEEAEIVSPGPPNPEHIFDFAGKTYRFQLDYTDLDQGVWKMSIAVDDVTTTKYFVLVAV
jgi:hypothetical protein